MRPRYDIFNPRIVSVQIAETEKIKNTIYKLEIMIENTSAMNPMRQQYIDMLFDKRRELNRLKNKVGGVTV